MSLELTIGTSEINNILHIDCYSILILRFIQAGSCYDYYLYGINTKHPIEKDLSYVDYSYK